MFEKLRERKCELSSERSRWGEPRRSSSRHIKMSFAQFSSSLPPSLSLKNRTGVVTGAASGIGRQVALHLARLGCAVLCADLNPLPREDVEGIRETQDGKLKTAEGVATHEREYR